MTIYVNKNGEETVINIYRVPTSKEVDEFRDLIRRRGYPLTIRKALPERASNWTEISQEADPKDPSGTSKGWAYQDELHKGRQHPVRIKDIQSGEYGNIRTGDMTFFFPSVDVDSGMEIEVNEHDEIIDNAGKRWLIEAIEQATDKETGAPVYWKVLCKKDIYGVIVEPGWKRDLGTDASSDVVIVEA